MNKITAKSQLIDLIKSSENTPIQSIKVTKKSATINNKESLKAAFEKASNTIQSKKPKLEDKIKDVLNHGLNYFKEVKNKALEDKANGVKPIQGAKDLWAQLSAEVNKLGQQAQNQVLDDFVTQSSTVIADSIKGTQIGDLLDNVLGTVSKTSSAATTATQTGNSVAGTESALAGSAASTVTRAAGTAAVSNIGNRIIAGVGAAYSLYQLYDTFGHSSPVAGAMNGATVGAYVGTMIAPGFGTFVGGLLGGIAGAGIGLINNRKHPERIQRDHLREGLEKFGFIDKDYNIKLADGTGYSLSTDGKKTIPSLDGSKRYGYQIDFSNPLAAKAIALSQPLAEVLTDGHDKLKTDLIGYLVNAATANAKNEEEVKANILSFYEQSKVSKEDLAGSLAKLTEESKISAEEIQVYANDLSSLFNPGEQDMANEELLAA